MDPGSRLCTFTSHQGEQPFEYERYVADLQPALARSGFRRLTEGDVRFLAGKTEIPALYIAFVACAAGDARIRRVPAEALGALFRGLTDQRACSALPATARSAGCAQAESFVRRRLAHEDSVSESGGRCAATLRS
jgi:hypothetical protein